MTLVRIDVIEGRRNPVQLEILADTVHSTIVEVFGAAVTSAARSSPSTDPAGSSLSTPGSGKAAPTTWSSSRSYNPGEHTRRSVHSTAS